MVNDMEVSLQKINKKYGSKTILQNINVDIKKGSFTVILGPSGSGKTTLLRLIAGLTYPSSGKILFDGEDVSSLPANKRNVAMVFQNYPLFPHMTVEENLQFPLTSQRKGKLFTQKVYTNEEINSKVEKVLQLLHIEEHRNKYPSQLSGGEQQRVCIGRELIREPNIFLFDEPLSNIDTRLRFEMRTWIRKLHSMINKTMIYVTHDQNEAMALGDTIILLNKGRIVQLGSPEQLYNEPQERFCAEFIGNFPMNFLPYELTTSEDKVHLIDSNNTALHQKIKDIIIKNGQNKGTIAFRPENIREYDETKPVKEEMMIFYDCLVEDIEKVLEKQVVTLKYAKYQLLFVTDTIKSFKIGEKIPIVVHVDEIFIFNKDGKRIT